jgi:hypothetical protein
MTTANARAAAVSRTLRQGGLGVSYSGASGYSALTVRRGYSDRAPVSVSLDESEHRARIGDVAEVLEAAGYVVTIHPADTTDPRYAPLRSLLASRPEWSAR